MPKWRFHWSQCVIFTGPIFEVISEAWCCTPIRCYGMHAHAAWTCMRTPAGRGATKCERNTTINAQFMLLHFGTWISGTDVSTTLSFFPVQTSVQTKIMNVLSPVEELLRTYLNPRCAWKMDRGKLSWAASVRESNLIRPENWNHFRCGTKQNARVQRWHVDVPTFNGSIRRKLLARR